MNCEKKLTITTINWDVLYIILQGLRDFDRLQILATCRFFWVKRCRFLYHTQVNILQIKNLPYFDNFCNIIVHGKNLADLFPVGKQIKSKNILPANTTHIFLKDIKKSLTTVRITKTYGNIFMLCPRITHVTLENSDYMIPFLPMTITHLTINTAYLCSANQEHVIKIGLISLKVICHSFLEKFPPTLQKLFIECKNPHSIQNIEPDSLPNGLQMISLTGNIQVHKDAIPASVKKIILGKNYTMNIYLPPNIQECVVHSQNDAKIIASRFPSIEKISFVSKNVSIPKSKNRRPRRPYGQYYEYTDR